MTVPRNGHLAEAPRLVRAACGLMMAGGMVHPAAGAVALSDNASRLAQNLSDRAVVGMGVAELGIITALWWWMAAKCYAGRSWARTLATLFFAIFVVGIFIPTGPITVRGTEVGLSWLVHAIGVAAVVLLWTPEANRYFRGNMDTT